MILNISLSELERATEKKSSTHPVDDLRQAMADAGLDPGHVPVFDGEIHRFGQPGRKDKPGWYVAHDGPTPFASFGSWAGGGETHSWFAGETEGLAESQLLALRIARDMAQAKAEAERLKVQKIAAERSKEAWASAPPADPAHPYLARKKIQPHLARQRGESLLIPVMSTDGIVGMQFIRGDGTKLFTTGTAKRGNSFVTRMPAAEDRTVYIAEGFATAASITEATGAPCLIAFDAGNLEPVAVNARKALGAARDICIVADNDESLTGEKEASKAAEAIGGRVALVPIVGMDANDYAVAGHDLAGFLKGLHPDKWLRSFAELTSEPKPVKWVIKSWLQEMSLAMIHGPPGAGKTFVALDMLLSVASGRESWGGQNIKHGPVIYLAGEGSAGMSSRLKAWGQKNNVTEAQFWASSGGVNLNTEQGLAKTIAEIEMTLKGTQPLAIAVDTLHRFLDGDENSAQDAKTMIDACDALRDRFGAAVILVHHTGVSAEAQHRARGSSAWRGALDVEIGVTRCPETENIILRQHKNKEAAMAEPLASELNTVIIDGWLDEDGEPVESAVIHILGVAEEAEKKPAKRPSRLSANKKWFSDAWLAVGKTKDYMPDGRLFLSRENLAKHCLAEGRSASLATVERYSRPSGVYVKDLIENQAIAVAKLIDGTEGYAVIDQTWASAMEMSRAKDE